MFVVALLLSMLLITCTLTSGEAVKENEKNGGITESHCTDFKCQCSVQDSQQKVIARQQSQNEILTENLISVTQQFTLLKEYIDGQCKAFKEQCTLEDEQKQELLKRQQALITRQEAQVEDFRKNLTIATEQLVNQKQECASENAQQLEQLKRQQALVTRQEAQIGSLTQSLTTATELLVKVKQACTSERRDGFEYFPSVRKHYKAIFDALSWDEAVVKCRQQSQNAHLAVVESEQEHQEIRQYLRVHSSNLKTKPCHTGIYDGFWTSAQRTDKRTCSTPYVWKPFYTNILMRYNGGWLEGEPNCYQGAEQCIQYLIGWDLKWNDISCNAKQCALCQIDAN